MHYANAMYPKTHTKKPRISSQANTNFANTQTQMEWGGGNPVTTKATKFNKRI